MIRSLSVLPNTAFYSAVYTKILALYNAYGSQYSFCKFWEQTDNDGKITAVICKYYSAITIYLEDGADTTELCEFANTVGFSEILSNWKLDDNCICLNGVNKACGGNGVFNFNVDINSARYCYNILNQHKDNIELPDFDSWYVDISHRIRHNTAFLINEENCTAFCLIGNSNALINGIAVNINYKNKGIGEQLIEKICSTTPVNNLWAICTDEVVGFYLSCGFKITEYIYLHKGL